MKLYLRGHSYRYAAEQMLLTLFPGQRPEYPPEPPEGSEPSVILALHRGATWATATARLFWEGREYRGVSRCRDPAGQSETEQYRVLQHAVKFAFYKAGVQALGKTPVWGALTGVRPVKLPTRDLEQGLSPAQAKRQLERVYLVSPRRAELAVTCAQASLRVKELLSPNQFSLYAGIPFCPSRCAYCSFVSADIRGCLKLVEPYLEALERETSYTGALARQAGTVVRCVYIGGGTPTTLSPEQLSRVLGAIRRGFDLGQCLEYTVEAGRPDTITAEKLAVLKEHGVDRISVNPQTLRDSVLRAMGRAHTAAQVYEACDLVRRAGFRVVNMDLIAGLPEDDLDGFRYSLDGVLDLAPENLTVHTLALKRGSALSRSPCRLPGGEETAAMLDYAWDRLTAAGYTPYYLYRQKYMSGGLENVGWCRPGCESVYNIAMMEELHTIVSLGAGGVTKLVDPGSGMIRRLANPKYPDSYLARLDRTLEARDALLPFWQRMRDGGVPSP